MTLEEESDSRSAQLHVQAAAHRREAARIDDLARDVERGEGGEAVVRRLLEPLELEGWTLLHGRRRPGKQAADLDHVLVGGGGVVVLDTKAFRGEVAVRGGRLWQGQADVTDNVEGLVSQVEDLDQLLVGHGLAPGCARGALVFVAQRLGPLALGPSTLLDEHTLLRWVRALPQRLEPGEVARLSTALMAALPKNQGARSTTSPVVTAAPAPRTPEQTCLFSVEGLDLDELERACRLPLEKWMTYLHPSQSAAVRRRYTGPSRLRGPAGCGKTVVALHRAAYLATKEPGDVLVVSFVRTLPRALASLYARLSPGTAPRVRFSGVHELALGVLRASGRRTRLQADAAETCFALAWARTGRAVLGTTMPYEYWREEVLQVIKGRGLVSFEDYRQLHRVGRRTPLGVDLRERVWDLYLDYQERLQQRDVHDFQDIVLLALQAVLRGEGPRYRFVVVDEVQDLDLVSLRLVAALVSDERDGLTLVGDGQQAVYAGGYQLKEAGLQLSGRGVVLERNYRNTRQILRAANALVDGDVFDDLDGDAVARARDDAVRDGGAVLVATGQDQGVLDQALDARLRDDERCGLDPAAAAVLCRSRAEAARLRAFLSRQGHRVMDLAEYDGQPDSRLKVGTVKRAKGLEFARVYLPRIDAYLCREQDAEPERVERERRELYVAMTRARDGLWMSQLATSPVVEADEASGDLPGQRQLA